MLHTPDRTDELRDLEELWAAPAAPEPVLRRRRPLPAVSGAVLGAGWVAFFLGVLLFEPAPASDVSTPLWGDLVVASFALVLLAGAFLGPLFSRFGFAAATLGGVLGVVVAVACRTTGHHMGSWWLAEGAAAAALTALAAAGLVQRLRR